MVEKRKLAFAELPAIGFGCMNLSHAYGNPLPGDDAKNVLQRALDLGIVHFDTAALYGFGRNEALVGPFLKPHRQDVFLASKCVLFERDGKRYLDGSPEQIRRVCDDSLSRLRTEVIDLYYLHRLDKNIPIEDSMGAMADLVREGKIRSVGLSEMSADTIRRAAAVHPVAALQSEYSLWSRNVEIGAVEAAREVGAAFVAFSTMGRGFLADMNLNPANFVEKDIRRTMPRFQEPHFSANRKKLLPEYRAIAREMGCTPAQLAIAWVLRQAPHIHAIPGTASAEHLEEDWRAGELQITEEIQKRLNALINQNTVSGDRYPAAAQAQIDTEEFEAPARVSPSG